MYAYDHENRLRGVDKAGDPDVELAAFGYDALGRRVSMVDYSTDPATQRWFVYDGDNVIGQYVYDAQAETWVRQRYYVHGPTYIDERAVMHDDGQNRDYYYVLDDLYSVAGLADQVGNMVESYEYDAYGPPTVTAHTFSDLDGDADVDGQDFMTLSSCYNGSLRPPKPGCQNPMADLDIDGDVDGQDFMTLSSCFNGSMRPPKCNPSSFAAGTSVVDNPYFFTGRRLDVFDLAAGGGEAATGGGDEPLVVSAEGGGGPDGGSPAFWTCFYSATDSATDRAAGPLDFNGDGVVDEDDLSTFLACVAEAGDWTTESLFGIVGGEGATLDGGPAVIGQTPGLVLYHYRARAQHPALGRFNQRDPLGIVDGVSRVEYEGSEGPKVVGNFDAKKQYTDGMSLYEYVRSSPMRHTDSTGLFAPPNCPSCAMCAPGVVCAMLVCKPPNTVTAACVFAATIAAKNCPRCLLCIYEPQEHCPEGTIWCTETFTCEKPHRCSFWRGPWP